MDLDHLLSWVRPIAEKDFTERCRFIRTDHWIGYPKANLGLYALEELIDCPKRQRMPNLLITGPTNNGKSKLVERFRRSYPPIVFPNELYSMGSGFYKAVPVLYLQMPPHPEVKRFYTILLDYMGLEVTKNLRTPTLEVSVINHLKGKEVKLLVIDEIHNMLSGRKDQQREFLNVIRFLGNDLQIPIVAVGTHDAYIAISSDAQLENRFDPFLLPPWKESKALYSLLASYATLLPLRMPSQLADSEVCEIILERTDGILGEMVNLLRQAAITAIRDGREKIDARLLRCTEYRSPTERRQMMARKIG